MQDGAFAAERDRQRELPDLAQGRKEIRQPTDLDNRHNVQAGHNKVYIAARWLPKCFKDVDTFLKCCTEWLDTRPITSNINKASVS